MINSQKSGFTIIEMLIVIVIITILVGAGGFYYRDLNLQTMSRKAREDAINLANIMNDVYRTGDLGVGVDSLNDIYVRKGTYPDTKKARLIIDRIKQKYGDQFTDTEIVVADKSKFKISTDPTQYPVSGLTEAKLPEKTKMIVYAPLTDDSATNASEVNLCVPTHLGTVVANYDYTCRSAIVYFVSYEHGKYVLRPVRRLSTGVAHDIK